MEKQAINMEFNRHFASSSARARGNHHGGGGVDPHDWHTKTKQSSKRQRRSTGGIYNEQIERCKSDPFSIEQFKSMNLDDKLVTLFKMLTCTNNNTDNLNTRVSNVEDDIVNLSNANVQLNRRVKTLEYKSIDAEARNRRNNLVFRGVKEIY
jgi:hypothetical protein